MSNQFSSLQSQISELQAENSELKNQNSELLNQNRELQSNISTLEDQISNLQESTYNLEITTVSAGDWQNLGGLAYNKWFNVTIQNNGPNDVGGVTSAYRITGISNEVPYGLSWIEPDQMGILHVGEHKLVRIPYSKFGVYLQFFRT